MDAISNNELFHAAEFEKRWAGTMCGRMEERAGRAKARVTPFKKRMARARGAKRCALWKK
jgi:hypothetical protein